MDAYPGPASPAPSPLQASVTWANPSPSLYQFPSYSARLNANSKPNPNSEDLSDHSDDDCLVDYSLFNLAPIRKKGISSEGCAVHEIFTNYCSRNIDTSPTVISGNGYGSLGWSQKHSPHSQKNSYTILESSDGPVKCPNHANILKTLRHVENGIRNISQSSIQVPSAVPNPTPSSQQSDTVFMKNSGFQFSSKPIENFRIGKFQKIPNRIARVRPHPHKSTHIDIHTEEKVEARNAGKEVMEAKDNQRTQLEQAESSKQSMSVNGNAAQHSSSCHPKSASIPGDTIGSVCSSVLMAEDAPLDVILEAFRYLLGILSSSDFDASELEDHDRELLQFVMDNQSVFTAKNKKDSRPKVAHSPIVQLKTNVVKPNERSHDMEKLSVASNMNNDDLQSTNHFSSSDLRIRENVAQTVEKTFESNFSNNMESLHAQVYKKLWIDAEAALCSLKYELQLAKMKIEAENRNHETEKLQQSPKVSSLNSMHEHSEQEVPVVAKESPQAVLPTAKETEFAPTTDSLKDKDDAHQLKSAKFSDLDAEGKLAMHVDSDTLVMPKETKPPASLPMARCSDVADVMARLKILKDRDDTPNSADTVEEPNLDGPSVLEDRHATFCSNGSGTGPSRQKSDAKIGQVLDPSVCSANTEAGSSDTQSDSGGDARFFSSDWVFELL